MDDYRSSYGVEPIYRVLSIAPLTYYRAKGLESCPKRRSLSSQHDEFYISEIKRIWRCKGKVITSNHDDQKRADDLFNRDFSAHHPNQLGLLTLLISKH